jgi:hypothetical protein
MNTYTITEAQLSKLSRMIDFAEYWLEDREKHNEQWESDNQEVNEAILVMDEFREEN